MTVILKNGYYRTPDYRIGNRTHTAKFKVVRNVGPMSIYFVYSIDSNLHDEIAGQDGPVILRWGHCLAALFFTWEICIYGSLMITLLNTLPPSGDDDPMTM